MRFTPLPSKEGLGERVGNQLIRIPLNRNALVQHLARTGEVSLALARRRIFKHLRTKAEGKQGPRKEATRQKVDSPFILTNRLTARHNGEKLSGRNTGKVGQCRTYYGITKARTVTRTDRAAAL